MALNLWRRVADRKLPSTRIARMDVPSLLNWYETTLMELGAAFDKYRYHGSDYEKLDEVYEILTDLHTELGARGKRD
jgi:hypothetical protein